MGGRVLIMSSVLSPSRLWFVSVPASDEPLSFVSYPLFSSSIARLAGPRSSSPWTTSSRPLRPSNVCVEGRGICAQDRFLHGMQIYGNVLACFEYPFSWRVQHYFLPIVVSLSTLSGAGFTKPLRLTKAGRSD